jgi:LmbE family N-acetylglucosaminyl deacetylase
VGTTSEAAAAGGPKPNGSTRAAGVFPPGPALGVWAHPDDETYLAAGLMAMAVRLGQRVVCVTATRGEEGSWDEERWPTATMGRVREAELIRSMKILGVTEHHWLDYYDGTCAEVDLDEGTKRVRAFVEEVQPMSVFTFGPEGMTGHPDHKSISAWTTRAFHQAAPEGASLYYATGTPEWEVEYVPRMQRFNVFMEPGTPPVTPHEEMAVDFELPEELMRLKLDAIEAHLSQNEHILKAFGQDFFRAGTSVEAFRLGARR